MCLLCLPVNSPSFRGGRKPAVGIRLSRNPRHSEEDVSPTWESVLQLRPNKGETDCRARTGLAMTVEEADCRAGKGILWRAFLADFRFWKKHTKRQVMFCAIFNLTLKRNCKKVTGFVTGGCYTNDIKRKERYLSSLYGRIAPQQ